MASPTSKTSPGTGTQLAAPEQTARSRLSGPDKPTNIPRPCPYHGPLLSLSLPHKEARDAGAMERFMSEGPAEQSAIFNRPDNNMLSISKGCTCLDKVEQGASRL